MPTRVPVATDAFTSTVNEALGANWTNINTGTFGTLTKQNNSFVSSHASLRACSRWVGAGSFDNDQYSKDTILEADVGSSSYGIGVIARATTNANGTFYYLMALTDDTVVMGVLENGSNTTIAGPTALAWVDGDTLSLEVTGANPSITLTAYRNDVPIGGAFTATGRTEIDSGVPGIMGTGDAAATSGTNWEGGNVITSVDPGHNNNPIFRVRLRQF